MKIEFNTTYELARDIMELMNCLVEINGEMFRVTGFSWPKQINFDLVPNCLDNNMTSIAVPRNERCDLKSVLVEFMWVGNVEAMAKDKTSVEVLAKESDGEFIAWDELSLYKRIEFSDILKMVKG